MGKMTRRDFMRHSLAVATGACCAQAFGTLGNNIVFAQTGQGNGRTVVLCRLDGGDDGCSSFMIPADTSEYFNTRPTIAIPQNLILRTASGHGFHPELTALHQLYLAGDVAVLPFVGTTTQSQSHDQEQENISKGGLQGIGWLGRAIDKHVTANGAGSVSVFNTIALGQGVPTDTLCERVEKRPLNLSDINNFSLNQDTDISGGIRTAQNAFLQQVHRDVLAASTDPTAVARSTKIAQQGGYQTFSTIAQARTAYAARPANQRPTYPNNSPGSQFAQIARLIFSNLGTQLALCGMGGFDLHSDLGATQTVNNVTTVIGNQATLLSQLDDAILAFSTDLKNMNKWNDVAIIVYTEFGRNARENSTKGVDHGRGFAMVVIGGGVNGGYRRAPMTDAEIMHSRNSIPVKDHYHNAFKESLAYLGLSSSGIFGPHTATNFGLFS